MSAVVGLHDAANVLDCFLVVAVEGQKSMSVLVDVTNSEKSGDWLHWGLQREQRQNVEEPEILSVEGTEPVTVAVMEIEWGWEVSIKIGAVSKFGQLGHDHIEKQPIIKLLRIISNNDKDNLLPH